MAALTTQSVEHILEIAEGQQLAYEDAGDRSSSDVVIFFHGAFGVGHITQLTPAFDSRQVHFIAPTVPGWGNSSSTPHGVSFHNYLYACITALLRHLHPGDEKLRIFLAGGSFGTVVAQILYGAPYNTFIYGRNIAAILLLAPFSPPHSHKDFTKGLSHASFFMLGKHATVIPFNLVPRLAVSAMKNKVNTRERAEKFIHDFAFKDMGPKEAEACAKWRIRKGIKEGEEGKDMAEGVYRSIQKTWDGFIAIPTIIHSGWGGYSPADLDDEHSKPVLIVVTKEDKENLIMGEWLSTNLKHASVRYEEGGHIGTLFVMDDIWEDFLGRYF